MKRVTTVRSVPVNAMLLNEPQGGGAGSHDCTDEEADRSADSDARKVGGKIELRRPGP
ncbi:MAG: hypothetical protein H0U43_03135 [Chthoniobacterales bacterium]|nr:hypothetical protein [Chthoniobacterales bacterium]